MPRFGLAPVFTVIAIVLFVLAALGVPAPVALVPAGLAFLAAAHLPV